MQPDPVDTTDAAQFAQQFRQFVRAVAIQTIAGNILRNDNQFFHTAAGKFLRLRHDILHRTAAVFSAQRGNHTIGTVVVAPFRNAQISAVFRRGQDTVALIHRCINAAKILWCAASHHFFQRIHNIHITAAA